MSSQDPFSAGLASVSPAAASSVFPVYQNVCEPRADMHNVRNEALEASPIPRHRSLPNSNPVYTNIAAESSVDVGSAGSYSSNGSRSRSQSSGASSMATVPPRPSVASMAFSLAPLQRGPGSSPNLHEGYGTDGVR